MVLALAGFATPLRGRFVRPGICAAESRRFANRIRRRKGELRTEQVSSQRLAHSLVGLLHVDTVGTSDVVVERDWTQRATIKAALGRVVTQHVNVSVGHCQRWRPPRHWRA